MGGWVGLNWSITYKLFWIKLWFGKNEDQMWRQWFYILQISIKDQLRSFEKTQMTITW